MYGSLTGIVLFLLLNIQAIETERSKGIGAVIKRATKLRCRPFPLVSTCHMVLLEILRARLQTPDPTPYEEAWYGGCKTPKLEGQLNRTYESVRELRIQTVVDSRW